MYLPLHRVWGGACVQLGLVEGMWDLKSGRLQFKSCLYCSQLYDLGSIIPGSLSFLLCKIRVADPSLWGLRLHPECLPSTQYMLSCPCCPQGSCCCFPIARLPQLVCPFQAAEAAGGGDGLCPSSAGPCPWPGLGPWGPDLETAVPTKQLKLLRPGEVLAAGVILGLAGHPRILFLLEVCGEGPLSSISGPSPSSLFASFPPWPEGWEERPLWVFLGGCPLVAVDPGRTPGACFPSLSSDFWGQRVSLITSQDLTLGSKLWGKQKEALMSDPMVSHCAVPLNLHVVHGRWSGDQQEFQTAQAPVDLWIRGCPPPTSPGTPSWAGRAR